MKNTAILMVSFGTSYKKTRNETITAIEKKVKNHFKNYDIFECFTSNIIRRKIEKTTGEHIFDIYEALEHIKKKNYENLIIQPTHIIPGKEFDKISREIKNFNFKSIKIGNPLLTTENDFQFIINFLNEKVNCISKCDILVLMGHGTEHKANAQYVKLNNMLPKNIMLATVEGTPTIDDIVNSLHNRNDIKSIAILPFMVVSGDHATNDMAGEDDNSWKSILELNGYEVTPILKGLGSFVEIQDRYITHILEAK